jgi:membrane protein DedA with SNARE-associated domain
MNSVLEWLLNSVHSVDWLLRNFIAAFAIACETLIGVGLVIPGDSMALVAGTGVQNLVDFAGLYLFVLAGSFAGESGGFWLGRTFGARIRSSALGRRIGEKNWAMADAFVETRGGLAVALSRFLPVLHSVVPVVTGMTTMRYRAFIRWTMAACSVWAAVYLGVGWALHRTYDVWLGRLKFGGVIFVAIVVIVIGIITLVKKRLEKAAENMVVSGETQLAVSETETEEGLE